MVVHKHRLSRLKSLAPCFGAILALGSSGANAEEALPEPGHVPAEAAEPAAEPTVMTPESPADADATPIKADEVTSEITYLSFNVIRLNPLGVQTQFDLEWKTRLYDPGDSLIKSNNFFSVGVSPIISPALARLGVAAKFQPLAILKLEVRWDYLNYFGNINILQSFQDANVDYSDTELSRRGDLGLNYATDGWQLTLDGELRAKVGPVIARSRFRAMYVDVALKNDDRVFYDQYFDLLLPRAGWFFTNDADLLFEITPKLLIGLRWGFLAVDYTRDNFATATTMTTSATPIHRLGPIVAYTFHDEPGSGFNKPTLFMLVNWHLKHPSRTGQDVSQAIPYFVLGFAFSGRVLPL